MPRSTNAHARFIPQRLAAWLAQAGPPGQFAGPLRRFANLAAVTAVPVGHYNDGLQLHPAGTPLDKGWSDLYAELTDTREAWSKNPLARRLVGLVTSYTVGTGISLQCEQSTALDAFIQDFWQHNNLDQRIPEWSDELARAGELFPVLFWNPVSGMTTVRTVPACLIETVDYSANDYETELRYRETQPIGAPEKWWLHPDHPDADANSRGGGDGLMLHYAVNRPIGAVRGESDLAPVLPWLRRYNRWLEDRVRLNAAVRSFLWIVHAPSRLRGELQERYRTPPDPGSVIIADADAETWEAVAPNLHAADAEKDGRAIRWMIVAGGPGTSLLDIGEGEDSNLATGKAMAEQRRRFLRRRQSYLAHMLIDLTWRAWELGHGVDGPALTRGQSVRRTDEPVRRTDKPVRRTDEPVRRTDITAQLPDISPEDNADLAAAAQELASALSQMEQITGASDTFRTVALRMFAKFAGETLSEDEIDRIIQEGTPTDEQSGLRHPDLRPDARHEERAGAQ